MTDLLHQSNERIGPRAADAVAAAEDRQGQLTKHPGSLERLGSQLAGIAAQCLPPVPGTAILGLTPGN
ncbi:MAG: hypothetical protein ACTHWA_06695 [Arachnia sp.]